jgi:hypothetical protein
MSKQTTAIVLHNKPQMLAKLDQARKLLAACLTLPEVKPILALAAAARTYAKINTLSRDSQNYAAEISIRAKRRAGEILESLERKPGLRLDVATPAGAADEPLTGLPGGSPYAAALAEIKVPGRSAADWRRLSKVPETTLVDYIKVIRDGITTNPMRNKAAEDYVTEAGLLRADKKNAHALDKKRGGNPQKTKTRLARGDTQELVDNHQKISNDMYRILGNKSYDVGSVVWSAFRGMSRVDDRYKTTLYLSKEEIESLPLRRDLRKKS